MNKIIPNYSTLIIDKGVKPKNGNIIAYQLDGDFGVKRFFETENDIFWYLNHMMTDLKLKL